MDTPRRGYELRFHFCPFLDSTTHLAILLNPPVGVKLAEAPLGATVPLAPPAEIVIGQRAVHVLDRFPVVDHVKIEAGQSIAQLDVLERGEGLIENAMMRE